MDANKSLHVCKYVCMPENLPKDDMHPLYIGKKSRLDYVFVCIECYIKGKYCEFA